MFSEIVSVGLLAECLAPTRCFKRFLPILPTKGIVFRNNGDIRVSLYSGNQEFGPVKYQILGRSLRGRPEGWVQEGVWMDHQAPVAPREGVQASSLQGPPARQTLVPRPPAFWGVQAGDCAKRCGEGRPRLGPCSTSRALQGVRAPVLFLPWPTSLARFDLFGSCLRCPASPALASL